MAKNFAVGLCFDYHKSLFKKALKVKQGTLICSTLMLDNNRTQEIATESGVSNVVVVSMR